MYMKRLGLLLMSVLLVMALILTSCGTQSKVKITLSEVTHSVFYAPFYVAINQGFFEQEGIILEVSNGQGADKVMTAVLSGQVDIGFAGPEASIYVYNEGKEDHAVVFAQLTKRDGAFIVGRNPEPGFEWENLRGKYIIGGRKGGVPEMALEHVLRKYKLEPNVDLTVDTSVQFAVMAGAFPAEPETMLPCLSPQPPCLRRKAKVMFWHLSARKAEKFPIPLILPKRAT
jgi:NitT/TauT family transport system substrate-binding protein